MIRQNDGLAVALPLEAIADFCRRWKIAKLELFGSALGEEFGPDSDLDFLYEMTDGARWGWDFTSAWDELAGIVGRPVDLISRRAVERSHNARRKREILETALLLYAA